MTIFQACSSKEEGKQKEQSPTTKEVMAKDILGNPDYVAISYGGYREKSRDSQPTLNELKDDMKLLSAI